MLVYSDIRHLRSWQGGIHLYYQSIMINLLASLVKVTMYNEKYQI